MGSCLCRGIWINGLILIDLGICDGGKGRWILLGCDVVVCVDGDGELVG